VKDLGGRGADVEIAVWGRQQGRRGADRMGGTDWILLRR
jgi:hypothetical protein